MSVESLSPRLEKAEELVAEQAYFDHAADAREAATTDRGVSQWSAGTAAERRAFARSFSSRSDVSLDDNVAFGRMDLDDGEIYYVGKYPVFDDEKNLLVVNWQSPAAAAYNQATARDPLGLLRKRSFDAERNRITDFQDTVFKELAQAVAELEQWQTPDDSLLAAMSEKRNGQMTDIVRTIQAAQDKIVRMDKDRLLIVQGGPGTGKTAVALHRVSWLLFNYMEELQPDDVLVIGPNPTFTRYIRRVLPDLGDNDVVQQALPEMLAPGTDVRAGESDTIAALKGSAIMADVIATGLADRIREPKGPVRIQIRSSGRFIEVPSDAVAMRIRALKSEVYLEGRAKLKTTLIELANGQNSPLARGAGTDLLDPKSLESVLSQMWPQLNPQQFVRELLGSKERLLRAAAGTNLRASDVELLYRPMSASIAAEPWTMADLALIDEATEGLRGAPALFGHIVVDEAQDLSEMQLMAIRRRSRNGSMTVVGDIAQSTGPSAMDNWERVEEMLASSHPCDVVELEHGYRVPHEVFALAAPVLAVAAPHVTPPLITRSAQAEPQFSETGEGDIAENIANIVVHHSGRGRFVGVIAVAELWEDIRNAFRADEIQWSESTSGGLSNAINLVTPEASKGLEFDAVIVVDPQSILDLPHGERLLYIALTRTTTRLDIVYPTGTLPTILGGNASVEGTVLPVAEIADGDVETSPKGQTEAIPVAPLTVAAVELSSSVGSVELSDFDRQMVNVVVQGIVNEMLSKVTQPLQRAVVQELIRLVG
ncbi:ATP-binding domain-containing protein [Arthrobacter sp. ZGTC212]|uniref:HelD family protein n=1 Tax=Arthrobacter sp. ZGTC212 TaxID=2058899 RepID=UPI000CE3093B|nr:ATP-binding domain-containing protein [Arthrobacter sp. ZGTC212]